MALLTSRTVIICASVQVTRAAVFIWHLHVILFYVLQTLDGVPNIS